MTISLKRAIFFLLIPLLCFAKQDITWNSQILFFEIVPPYFQKNGIEELLIKKYGDHFFWIKNGLPTNFDKNQPLLGYCRSFLDDKIDFSSFPDAFIKIAYFLWESTTVPKDWVNHLNVYFDLIVVADEFEANVLKGSNVVKPIFVLPYPLDLNPLLKASNEKKLTNKKPFIFGSMDPAIEAKNLTFLIKTFHQTFQNREDIKLIIHSTYCGKYFDPMLLINLKEKLGAKNVEISWGELDRENYMKKMEEFDCYISLSKGEAYADKALEALSLGIPCIIPKNTGQKFLCDSNLVYSIKSKEMEPACLPFLQHYSGCFFNCKEEDVKTALVDVYQNYLKYFNLAKKSHQWIQNFSKEVIEGKLYSLLSPNRISQDKRNEIYENTLSTSSAELYKKYLENLNR